MRGADIQKVPSLDFCKLLGGHLIICSNPSGVFSTVTHSVVQGVGATAARYRHGGGYSFCCPSCPGCPRTVTRPLKSAPRRRHRPTAQPLRATSSLPRARYRSKPLNSAPRHRCRSTAQVCATSSLPLNRRDFLRRGFLRRDLGGAISPFTFHLSLLLSHFTSIRQIRQFLRDTYTDIQTDDIYSCSELEYPSFFRPTRILTSCYSKRCCLRNRLTEIR